MGRLTHDEGKPRGESDCVTTSENTELIRQITEKVVNGGDLTIVRDLFAAEFVAHKTGMSLPRGPEAFKMAVRQWRDAFPDYHVTIDALFAAGDLVTCRFTASGTHEGALLGIPPSGRPFTLTAVEVHRIAGGLVAESWLADDIPRILTEVGVLAPSASAQWT